MPRAPVHFGVTLPQIKRTWAEAHDAAVELEALGFDSLWVCDHLQGVPAPQLDILEAWTLLGAVAAVTSRVELGTLVTPPGFRPAAVLAKQAATVDAVAGGRVVVGLGSGWAEREFAAYGLPFPSVPERMEALAETAVLLRRLWTEERVTFSGRWVQADDAWCQPKPPRRLPLLVGGSGERLLLRVAAEHADIWNNTSTTQGELGHKIEVLRRHCAAVGRDPDEITVSQQCNVVLAADEDTAREALAKAARLYGPEVGAGLERHGIWGTPDQVIAAIERHIALGCRHFVMELFGRDTRIPARLFATEVLPAFR
ncbi:MAG TPA: LLM class flavin-dependent oxidoreductase [Acidimicrobiales bacterium]|nr:LLM class flavin-dependent oxidoreductase [Acidimicrobiales bacterium]